MGMILTPFQIDCAEMLQFLITYQHLEAVCYQLYDPAIDIFVSLFQ